MPQQIPILDPTQIAALLLLPGVGRAAVRRLIERAFKVAPQGPQDLQDFLLKAGAHGLGVSIPTGDEMEKAYEDAEILMKNAEHLGMKVLTPGMPAFPPQLCRIPDSPVMLYVKGNVNCLSAETVIAVIGTREPSRWGATAAERIAASLAAKGIVVTSGLALGCDTAAHRGCMLAGGHTIAVMAHGLDRVYPAQNRQLAAGILNSGGCLVSEYAPGVAPSPKYFVERDRLQSGLSGAVIVIETNLRGGTMHTVGFCLKQGRLLGCVAHPSGLVSHPKAQGNRKLIAEKKAIAIPDKEALEEFLGLLPGRSAQ